jgi:penicillin amidase
LVLALVASASGCFWAVNKYKKNPPLPSYTGTLKLSGLQNEVNVYRDNYAVPHIMAQNTHDLFFTVGYLQATDRLWEMVLLRAMAQGRTSELLGKFSVPGQNFHGFPISTFGIDLQERTMGMKYLGEVGAALLAEYDPEVYAELAAYCDGVNALISSRQKWEELPIEFQVLRVRPEPWQPADIVSFGRFMGFYLGYNMMVELFRYDMIANYGEEKAWQMTPTHLSWGPTIVPPEMLKNKLLNPRNLIPGERPPLEEMGFAPKISGSVTRQLLASQTALRDTLRISDAFASNNWIISGKLTQSGFPMLENDPHLLPMEPSIWYMMHLIAPGMDVYGVAFPGVPFTALGHTRKLAWGATTSIADVQDLFIETVDPTHPGMYLYQGEWRPFTVRKEIIRVRVGSTWKDEEIKIRQSIHGPIISDLVPLPKGTPLIALRWVAWDFSRDPKVFEALVQSKTVDEFMTKMRAMPRDRLQLTNQAKTFSMLMRGQSIKDFTAAMDVLDLPSQNWMAADADGHIAYLPGGLIPIRKKGLGVLPVPGEKGEFDWAGFIPTSELPQAIDPERGWMASGNNEVVDAEWYPYIFDLNYDGGWRAWRIENMIKEQIAAKKPFTMEDMKRMQNDVYVQKAEVEVPLILQTIERKHVTDPQVLRAAEEFKKWDLLADLDSTAAAIFFQYTIEIRSTVLADEVSKADFDFFFAGSQTDIIIETLIRKGASPLFDDKTTKDKVEDMDDALIASVKAAMAFIEKKYGMDPKNREWGKVHVMKFYHPLGIGPLNNLSVGPFPHVGSRHTVRCASPADSGRWPFKTMNGSSWRHLIDMGDPDHAQVIIDGSISGQWLSPHYKDLVQVWLRGDHLTGTMDPEEIKSTAEYHMVFTP